jgi:hypothetical protein
MATTDGDLPTLTLYGRSDCHLCDEMIAGLQKLQDRFQFALTVIDIDSDAALQAQYDEHIPVLAHGSRELCRHALDSGRLTDYLAKIR